MRGLDPRIHAARSHSPRNKLRPLSPPLRGEGLTWIGFVLNNFRKLRRFARRVEIIVAVED
ncbi:MAG: hypothetical protein WAJ91_06550, partial [Rhodoplanes sp.]